MGAIEKELGKPASDAPKELPTEAKTKPEKPEAVTSDEVPDEVPGEKADEAPEEEVQAAEEAGEAKGDEEKKEVVEDDFTAPQGLKERSAKRWAGLVTRLKDAETSLRGVSDALKDTGAPAEQIAQALNFVKLIHSGSPASLKEALSIIERLRGDLAMATGSKLPGVDMLSGQADLTQQVEDGTLPEEIAIELANARRLRAQMDQNAQLAANERQVQEARAMDEATARGELNAIGVELSKSDIDYQAKLGLLRDNKVIENIARNFPPSRWAEQFRFQYALLNRLPEMTRPTNRAQPMRPLAQVGAKSAQPKTLAEAVARGLNIE